MTKHEIENSDHKPASKQAAYEAHLRNLHADAAARATKMLDESGLLEAARGGSEYEIVLCFEVIRQLAHETCKGFSGTGKLLQLVKGEVDELWSDELSICAGSCWMTDMKSFRESKNGQLSFLDHKYFEMFFCMAAMGLMPDDMPGLEGGVN